MVQNHANPPGNSEEPKQLRLTLRTLLAYLDDVLEPNAAREIGSKIQETQYASQLVDRIQDVLRRRRVAAPELNGPAGGLDPNTVAEYLDNTLPPQAVPDVERVCLESDVHLAEVAACHQILTLVLGDPIHVSAESRERLHALIPAGLAGTPQAEPAAPKSEPQQKNRPKKPKRERVAARSSAPAESPKAEPASASHNGHGRPAASKKERSETLPDYLKSTPFWKRALVPALVAGVLLLWVGLLFYDSSMWGSGSKEKEEVAQNDPQPPAKSKTATPEIVVPALSPPVKTVNPTPQENNQTPEPANTNPMPPVNPDNNQLASNDKTNVPVETLPPGPEKLPTTTETTDPLPPAKEVGTAPPVQTTQVLYTTDKANNVTSGLLLRYDAEKTEWNTLPQLVSVMLEKNLACPEAMDAVLKVSKSDCDITLIGGALASFQTAKAPAVFQMNLDQGKVVFARKEAGEDPLVLHVKVGGDLLVLELADGATRCGLEILPRFPNQVEQGLGPNWYTGSLMVEAGGVRLTDRTGATHTLAARQSLDITPLALATGEAPAMPPVVQVDQPLPEWLNPGGRTFRNLSAHYMRQFYRAFEEAGLESDVTTALLPLAKDEKTEPTVAVMAAKTLAMTGCVRDVADLLSLGESSPEEIRLATIEATRRWLTLNPDKAHGQLLRTQLGYNVHKDTADAISRLLWGYRKSDLEQKAVALDLVDKLNHDHITVRTLAFLHLSEMSGGKTYNYRPLQKAAERDGAVKRWRSDVNEGKLFLGN